MSTISERVAQRTLEAEADAEEDVGELEIAEYVIFLLALDTYSRYIEEVTDEEASDELVRKGIQLVRMADRRYAASVEEFLAENVSTPAQKKLVTKAFKRLPNPSGLARRTLDVRTALSKGGPGAMRAVFKTNKALRGVRAAIEASTMDDADAALDKLTVIPMRNQKLRKWIDEAAETAGSGTYQDPIQAGSEEASDAVEKVLSSRVQEEGTVAGTSDEPDAPKEDHITQVQQAATETAQKAMQVSGEPDEPPAKSEVVGIASAAAVAAATDPSNPNNIPSPLRKLDDEQRAAALTDGKVLVAAGAGSGKSTTVVSRVEYLIKNRRMDPSRVLVTSFNTKAAAELKQKIGKSVGGDIASQMSVGTMHKLFKSFVKDYGEPDEVQAMTKGFIKQGGPVARMLYKHLEECYPPKKGEESKSPKLKTMMLYMTNWTGNNVTPDEAIEQAESTEELEAAQFYRHYEGAKGAIPGYEPPCSNSKTYQKFLNNYRPNGERLGDFSDMIGMFHDILKRDPGVRKTIQGLFDHIIIDECQDLDERQNSVFEMMSEHIPKDGQGGKSIWMVGDDSQSIYTFRGARPDIFTNRFQDPDWNTKTIRTNYRCPPEVVELANKLISNNDDRIPMEANPPPSKNRGMASVRVETSLDEATAALNVVESIKAEVAIGSSVSDFAILTRTNKEQHAFETACIIRGVPYARKGSSSFLGSPETTAVLGYVQLATGTDFGKMQKALGQVLDKPNRFFLTKDAGPKAVEAAFQQYARITGESVKNINPVAAILDPEFREILAVKLTKRGGKYYGFMLQKNEDKLGDLALELSQLQAASNDPDFKTTDMFDTILSFTGTTTAMNPATGKVEYIEQTFRESMQAFLKASTSVKEDEEAEDEEAEDDGGGLGNISFLYELSKADPTDQDDLLNDPATPLGFKAKMDRYVEKIRELRIDLNKWEAEQSTLPPEQQAPPPGVYLGTAHSTKGAQWANCYVSMPKGKFPMERKRKPGAPPPDPNDPDVKSSMADERRLAYVALTRAAKNLTVVCPSTVDGNPAGISPFVDEAGLSVGENVAKPNASTVDDEERVKTAGPLQNGGYFDEDYEGYVEALEEASYDWRK